MLERTEKISLRISSVLSKVEPETGAGPSHRLHNTACNNSRLSPCSGSRVRAIVRHQQQKLKSKSVPRARNSLLQILEARE